jgi:hypothetical protein
MAADRFVHLPPLTPIEARVLYGVLAAWCNGRDKSDPAWAVVDSLRTAVGEARSTQDLLRRASSDA